MVTPFSHPITFGHLLANTHSSLLVTFLLDPSPHGQNFPNFCPFFPISELDNNFFVNTFIGNHPDDNMLLLRCFRPGARFASVQRITITHLNRDQIESNFSVPGIQGHQENAFFKSFEMSSHLICL